MATRLKCSRCSTKWSARDMEDIFCRKCGAVGENDVAVAAAQRRFDAMEDDYVEFSGARRGDRPRQK